VSALGRNMLSHSFIEFSGKIAAMGFVLLTLACSSSAQDESLGDYARKLNSQQKQQVQVSEEDGRLLLKSVDEITQFSSRDSGLPRLGPVKRQLIGRTEAGEHIRGRAKDEAEHERRLNDAAVVLKKFGMLPPQFELSSSLGEYTLNSLAGFYEFSDKTMYLLNWVSPDLQKMVMAHELTHALQDQNFQLGSFVSPPRALPRSPAMKANQEDPSEISLARRAVVEGQATVVGMDYTLKSLGLDESLTSSQEVRTVAEQHIQDSYSPAVVIHDAPRLLREIIAFPYREGLAFELAVLAHGGQQEAFRGVFACPPINTHQVLQPEAYFKSEKTPRVEIGDLHTVFEDAYLPYEAGSLGELDVQIMSEQYGRENDIYTVARQWNGGTYLALKHRLLANAKVTTADLALVYVSRWKTRQAAERFGQIYLIAVAKRLPMGAATQHRCEEKKCAGALWEEHAQSSEGPVNVEVWPENLLIITQSVDDKRMKLLRPLLLHPEQPVRASVDQQELSPRFFALPEIQALSEQSGTELRQWLIQQFAH